LIVDAHQHFWNPARGDYLWIPKGDPVLDRRYVPADLAPSLAQHKVDRTVLVQAAASVAESDYLLGLADATSFVAGVVGWVDFEKPAAKSDLARLAGHPAFKGVRPMIQDIPDINWMLREDIQWAYRAICDLDLTFDALGFPRHVEPFLALMKRYPALRVVVDHGMKPAIKDHDPTAFAHWAEGMTRIAGQTHAFCKFSGLITEAGADWTVDDLRPYADHLLRVFGPKRIMWGSDWPVSRLAGGYDRWWDAARDLTSDLPPEAQDLIFGGTARQFYRLDQAA
jgi:L-fuconolactonase